MLIESDKLKIALTKLLGKKLENVESVLKKLDVIYWVDDFLGIIEEVEKESGELLEEN